MFREEKRMKVKVGISNRHVHLTKEDKDILFGNDYELTKRNDLVQPGEYACEETVIIEANDKQKQYVRVLGPLRNYTQVEILKSDSDYFGINAPYRNSGELENAESITIIGPEGMITKNCCIIANRHIHMNSFDNFGYDNNDIVSVKFNDIIIDDVFIKKSDNYALEIHLDKDDSKIYNINTNDVVEIIKKGD